MAVSSTNILPSGLEQTLEAIRESRASSFYRARWGSRERFEELPAIAQGDLVTTPLSARTYKMARGVTKVVHGSAGSFLSTWSYADIEREAYGVSASRPMVYMSEPHEAIEKAMWHYEHNMVPLIGEPDADIAALSAERYGVDALITDMRALERLTAYLRRREMSLNSLTVIGASFDTAALELYRACAYTIRLVLALPETGVIAEAPLTAKPVFIPAADGVLEHGDVLTVTKCAMLTTPIIRYQTHLRTASTGDSNGSFVLQ